MGLAASHGAEQSLHKLSVEPLLKDAVSDKKFTSSDYAHDTRPVVDKKVLNKLKSDEVPYPALQSTAHYEKDFVKDENRDTGHWQAQFEYDSLRKKLLKEEAEEKSAKANAEKEGHDVDEAQKKADGAAKDAHGAKKDVDAAKADEGSVKDGAKKSEADADAAAPSKESQAEMEKKVAKAEENYEEQKKKFEECKKQLEDAKVKYEDLKAQMAEMEKKGASEMKLWAERKDEKLRSSKSAMDIAMAKRQAAEYRLESAQKTKVEMETALAKEKAESEQAQKNLQKEKAEKEQAKADLEKATQHLQKLRGYAPTDHHALPVKSGTIQAALPVALLTLLLSW